MAAQFPPSGGATFPPSGGGGGSSGGTPIVVSSTVAGLGTPSTDGALGIIRIGTWPNVHDELLRWNDAQNKWVGEPITLITQNDSWAMDLGNRSGSQLLAWSYINNPVPFGRSYALFASAQNVNNATLNMRGLGGHDTPFPTSGTLTIRDNVVTYTGITGTQAGGDSPFSFTGCTRVAGSAGTLPTHTDVCLAVWQGGYGMIETALPNADLLWATGLRLQEELSSLCNAAPNVSPSAGEALSIAPYWYQFDTDDGAPFDIVATGGLGLSNSLTQTVANNWKGSEQTFYWEVSGWLDWAGGIDPGKVPTKSHLIPRIFGKMATGAVDTGEVLDTTLRVRWVSE